MNIGTVTYHANKWESICGPDCIWILDLISNNMWTTFSIINLFQFREQKVRAAV